MSRIFPTTNSASCLGVSPHTQGDEAMRTHTSRRALIAGAITMPIAAAAVPVPALAETDDA
jgi:hypothetical protein